MTLSIMPCHDKEITRDSNDLTSSFHKNIPESNCQDENCPPLCACSCCGQTVVVHPISDLLISKIETKGPLTIYPTLKISSISNSIWQPPKV